MNNQDLQVFTHSLHFCVVLSSSSRLSPSSGAPDQVIRPCVTFEGCWRRRSSDDCLRGFLYFSSFDASLFSEDGGIIVPFLGFGSDFLNPFVVWHHL